MILANEICKDLTDSEIVSMSLKNLDYFSCLFQRFEAELTRYLQRIGGLEDPEIQDILQESFVKIWRNLNDFDHAMKLSSWVYRIVHNEAISLIRKKKSYGKDHTMDIEVYKNILLDDSNTDAGIANPRSDTMEILNHLPLKYREILILKFLEQKNYQEISDILKMPEGTVAIRISRAKKKFREFYEKRSNQ